MKRISFSFLIVILICKIYGQNSLNDLNVIFKHDFENNTPGDYVYSEWQRDWLNPSFNYNQSETDIVQDVYNVSNPSKTLQINYEAGTFGGLGDNGVTWYTYFKKVDELYISYDIMFMPGFQFNLGGKLPSVQGGNMNSGDSPNGYNYFTGGLMFHKNGLVYFYIYYPDSKDPTYGDSFLWGNNNYEAGYFSPSHVTIDYGSGNISVCTPGEWHNITYRMVLNTVKPEGGGNYDGILEAYFDGKLVSQISHFLFRHTADLGIDCLRLYSFFGGNTAEWATPIDEWMRLDNIILYTYKENVDVPRGNVLSPKTRTINYWRQFSSINTMPPAAPTSLRISNSTKSSVTLNWTDNSNNEYGFKIYRSLNASDGFSEIASVTTNITTYTDHAVQPGTAYYYRLLAYNDVGNSAPTASLSASTLPLQLPASPAGLTATSVNTTNVTLKWSDLSDNEIGFQIERSGPDDFSLKKYFNVAANTVSFYDSPIQMNGSYQYRIRAYNGDGNSDFSNIIRITTPYVALPGAPTSLRGTEFTDNSITLSWSDNSTNENSFIITRTLTTDPSQTTSITVNANETSYTDTSLPPSTSYIYSVKAVNAGGTSGSSNKNILSTLSFIETQRIREGLVAYYNFNYNPDYVVPDLSGYNDPVNIAIQKSAAIDWIVNEKLSVMSNASMVSMGPVRKIVQAIKQTNAFSFECWIKPAELNQSQMSRIISLGNNDSDLGFSLNQEFTVAGNEKSIHFSTRTQTESTNRSGYPELVSDQTINYINMLHLTYVLDSAGQESLYINGLKTAEGFRPGGIGSWSDSYYLRLGNESGLPHSWEGTFYTVAVYNRALTAKEIKKNYSLGACDSLTLDDLSLHVSVYPNPLQGKAIIELVPRNVQDITSETTIRIFDIYGNVKYQEVLFDPNNPYCKEFDFTSYSKGVYFLQILAGNKQKSTKIIVQ